MIKTRITGDALRRALEKHQRWLDRYAKEQAAAAGVWSADPERARRADRRRRGGFASMAPEQQRAIASKGGRASHEKGTAHEWSAEEARSAGRKGGLRMAKAGLRPETR